MINIPLEDIVFIKLNNELIRVDHISGAKIYDLEGYVRNFVIEIKLIDDWKKYKFGDIRERNKLAKDLYNYLEEKFSIKEYKLR